MTAQRLHCPIYDIFSALDDSHAVAHVILDLSPAFDTIGQSQLLSLLNAEFCVHDKALSWLETYLEARTQRVKIGEAISEPNPLACGVPQGSVLGPILFTIIYTIIIIIRQPLCSVVGRRPQHVVSKLPCLVLSSAISCRSSICPGRLSTAWLVSLVVFSCHMVSKR